MNRIRVIVAGIAGGIVMFLWGFLSHETLKISDMYMKELPSEAPVVEAITGSVSQRGFYFFPGMGAAKNSETAMKEWIDKASKGPTGIVIYNPGGFQMMQLMLTEVVSNVAAALILAAVLARVSGSRPTRIMLAGLMGVAAWLAIDVSYWNWYKFPDTFALAGLIDQTIGWLLAGIAITLVLGKHMIAAPIGGHS